MSLSILLQLRSTAVTCHISKIERDQQIQTESEKTKWKDTDRNPQDNSLKVLFKKCDFRLFICEKTTRAATDWSNTTSHIPEIVGFYFWNKEDHHVRMTWRRSKRDFDLVFSNKTYTKSMGILEVLELEWIHQF